MSVINQIVSYPIIQSVYPYAISDSASGSVLDLLIYIILADLWFYWAHRTLHYAPIYRRVHYLHHQWVYPIAVSTLYAHPIEHIVCNLGAILIGPLIYPSSLTVIYIWTVIVTLNAVFAHCGLDLPGFTVKPHDIHHRYLSYNYGTIGFSDRLWGTARNA